MMRFLKGFEKQGLGLLFRCSGCGHRWCNGHIFRFRWTFRVHRVRCPECGRSKFSAYSLDYLNLRFISNREGRRTSNA